MIWQVFATEVTCNKLEMNLMKNENKFIKEENKLKMETDARLLAD